MKKRPLIGKDLRSRASRYADREAGPGTRGTLEWRRAYNGFTAGWISANRQRYAELRVKIERSEENE